MIPKTFARNSLKLYSISQIFIDLNRSISCIKCYLNFSQIIFWGQIAVKYVVICQDNKQFGVFYTFYTIFWSIWINKNLRDGI